MITDFGTVNYQGKILTLTQQAYADNYGTNGGVRYYAHAVDADGNEYIVAWDTTGEWDTQREIYKRDGDSTDEGARALAYVEDESNACDWDSPANVEVL